MLVGGKLSGEAVQKVLHRELVRARHHPGVSLVRAGADGGEQIGECEAIVGLAGWTLSLPIPAVRDAALLADARLVLEPERQALVWMCISNRLEGGSEPP